MPVMLSARLLGRRIVVRYRRADGLLPPLSDVVGQLVSLTAGTAVVAGPTGPVTVDLADIVAARPVAPNRRQILELERISRRGWRAAEVTELDGWLLCADLGWTGRANSVLPLATPRRPLPGLLAEAGQFYADRGLPLQIQLPLPARGLLDAELAGRCWSIERPTIMLTSAIGTQPTHPLGTEADRAAAAGVELDPAPSPDWLAAYHYRGGPLPEHAVRLLTRHDQVCFASLRQAGATVGIARGVVDEGWLGVTAVEVAADHRRNGVGRALMRALLDWGRSRGANQCYLQVDVGNLAALAFYDQLGFTEHHRYHYRIAPAGS
jgi:GNAT superfamily N-acetyltransferase